MHSTLLDGPDILCAALDCLDRDAFGDAATLGRSLLDADTHDTEALPVTGLALGGDGHLARAAPLLTRVATARPAMAHPCRDLAVILPRLGRATEIPALFRHALAAAPDDAGLRYAFADHLQEAGEPAEAAEILAPVVQAQLDRAAIDNLMGICLPDSGDTDPQSILHRER